MKYCEAIFANLIPDFLSPAYSWYSPWMHISQIREDLLQEQQDLDAIVADLPDGQWQLPTPSPRWNVADQIAHLTYFDIAAVIAITDPEAFQGLANELLEIHDGSAADDYSLLKYREMSPRELLSTWRKGRTDLAAAAKDLGDKDRVIWYGPSMGSKSFLTARLMEVWAHGQDIVDTVGAKRIPTNRLRHIAQLGYITRSWSYINRGLNPVEESIFVTLISPSGEKWEFGSEKNLNRISGTALDFCLVVTQRRHVGDTDLSVTGEAATEWLSIAQAFAGPATDGPQETK